MKYKKVYYFAVQGEVEKDNQVYCLDKETEDVFIVNDMPYSCVLGLLEAAKKEEDRFEFWLKDKESGIE